MPGLTRRALLLAGSAAMLAGVSARAQETLIFDPLDRIHPVWAQHGMVASQEALATRIGVDILRRGGNAVDAAVAVGFALAVTLPRAGNLGGGGFMVIHDARTGRDVAIDYRELAPKAATRDQYLDASGNPDPNLSRYHGLAVGVPGTVAGLAMALENYGTLPLKDVIAPAIALARDGITVTPDLADSLLATKKRFAKWPSSMRIFAKPDGGDFQPGDVLKQGDLAQSLQLIADGGPQAFYQGPLADRIAQAVQAAGGNMSADDLHAYRAVEREPVRGSYRGYEIVSMPPPSSGGVHVIQILNILEGYPIGWLGPESAETIHLMAEAMKLAFADRSEHLGDPEFVQVPVKGLTSKAYAAELRARIDRNRASPAAAIKPGQPAPYESDQTTHYSVVDKDGNAVSNTYTLNFSYGTGLVAEGTGILLNNELDDFSAKPGVPNAYGLVGGEANAVAGGKRPLSSMSPTIVLKDGAPFLVTGSPGGSRIITTVLQVIMNVVDHGMNVAEASAAPRIHHQWLPDRLDVETGLSPDTVGLLAAKGHDVAVKEASGSTQTIMLDPRGYLLGSTDPRRPGSLAEGY
jgi:gamma-glutamyltranspeptidase/glutathione hydrolase